MGYVLQNSYTIKRYNYYEWWEVKQIQTVGVRLEDDIVAEIDARVNSGAYKDRSAVIREAVEDKLYPDARSE